MTHFVRKFMCFSIFLESEIHLQVHKIGIMGIGSYCPGLGEILGKSSVRCLNSLLVRAGGDLFTTVIKTVAVCWHSECVVLFIVALVSCKHQTCPMIPILCKLDLKDYWNFRKNF